MPLQVFEDKVNAEMAEEEEEEGSETKTKQRPQFDEHVFLKKWDEDNPEIHVPPEVIDDVDNDYNLESHDETKE